MGTYCTTVSLRAPRSSRQTSRNVASACPMSSGVNVIVVSVRVVVSHGAGTPACVRIET